MNVCKATNRTVVILTISANYCHKAQPATNAVDSVTLGFKPLVSSHLVILDPRMRYASRAISVDPTHDNLLWPDTEHYSRDIIVSIGAGYDASSRRSLRRANTWWWWNRDQMIVLFWIRYKVARILKIDGTTTRIHSRANPRTTSAMFD
ncbi:hypothetical protein GJ744_006048 [Endocarpon pusillum]|uniref:Uncharacterized protein n=1 Tax=Endocarpon pusillum TaxID=364733 RepID=A0A8H7APL3_9EURO|nr:hypothetical protein GJ744_006048 [Endocarpon pusillum]